MGDLAFFAGGQDLLGNSSAVVDIYNASSLLWTSATLSQARYELAATTVGSLALFAGGVLESSVPTDRVDIYNSTSHTWSNASLSEPRGHLAATTVGALALFAGGQNASGNSDRVDIYDVRTNAWTTASLSTPRAYLSAVTVLDIAIFAGGREPYGGESAQVDIYNATSNSWRTANLSEAMSSAAAVAVGNHVLIGAGVNTSTMQDPVDIYDAASSTWSVTIPLQPRAGASGAGLGNVAVFAGGLVDFSFPAPSVAADLFDSATNFWTPGPPLSLARMFMAVTTVIGRAVFAGGFDKNFNASAAVDIYNLDCAAGSITNTTAADGCALCSAGLYANTTGSTSCRTCGEGTYSGPGAVNCSFCPAGTASAAVRATSAAVCSGCGAGTFSLPGAPTCSVCPSGTISGPGSSSCHAPDQLPSSSGISAGGSVGIALAVIFVAGIAGAAIGFYLRRRTRQQVVKADIELLETMKVDNIEVGERLGAGSNGEVFLGTWNGTTPVALKQLKSQEDLKTFAAEATLLQSLNHPNVVRFMGIHARVSGEHYIVMEYLPKGSLDVVLVRETESITVADMLGMYAALPFHLSCNKLSDQGETRCCWHGLLSREKHRASRSRPS